MIVKMKMTKVLLIHSPNLHEAHRMFAETIGADLEPAYPKELKSFRRFVEAFKRAKVYPDYPVYVLEGGMPMFPVFLKKRKSKDIKVIGLLADETFINLVDRQKHYSFAETLIHRISAKCLDGAIADSPFVKSYADRILDIPIKVVRPPLSKENYEKLGKVKPNLESNIIVSVGIPRFSIGLDILVQQFEQVKRKIPELELWIVGKGHSKEYEKVGGVKVLGFVKDLSEVFEKASLFVHAGWCSSYSIASVEAMRAGVPVVISDMTGAKEIVKTVEEEVKDELGLNYEAKRFIQPVEEIAEGIIAYYSTDKEERELLSEKYRSESEEFEPKRGCEYFKKVFEELLEEIR